MNIIDTIDNIERHLDMIPNRHSTIDTNNIPLQLELISVQVLSLVIARNNPPRVSTKIVEDIAKDIKEAQDKAKNYPDIIHVDYIQKVK